MKVLLVYPSSLLYSEIFLRLEPIGLELVGSALKQHNHDVHLLDLQIFKHEHFFKEVETFRPDAIGFCLNYLANLPEVLDLSKEAKRRLPQTMIFVGGHCASFIPEEILEHGGGAVDCVIQGEGEATTPALIDNLPSLDGVPGVVHANGRGPRAELLPDINTIRPARELTRRRRKYFIGKLDPCASIEFSRGCPWDCTFCSAWTFYNRSYRKGDPEVIAHEMQQIQEPNVFIVDDVAFIYADHGMEIARAIEKRGVKKHYYIETRCDVLLRNQDVFECWAKQGLTFMFLGVESLNADQLEMFRKRISPNQNFEALEVARKFNIRVAINLITDPSWDEEDFQRAREWALHVPEVVHLSVATPYPGTELFNSQDWNFTTRDYRLFDIQHTVLPTKLPLKKFYEELVKTQMVINSKFLGLKTAFRLSSVITKLLLRGQTNFTQMLFKFNKVYNAERFYNDHFQPVPYQMKTPANYSADKLEEVLSVHQRRKKVSA